jgi:hypothetical protein
VAGGGTTTNIGATASGSSIYRLTSTNCDFIDNPVYYNNQGGPVTNSGRTGTWRAMSYGKNGTSGGYGKSGTGYYVATMLWVRIS